MKKIKNDMKTLKRRWRSETPRFFKNIIKLGLTIGAAGLAIPTLPFAVPAIVLTAATKMVVIGSTAAVVAKFAELK
jgi:hypothetical protein